MTRASLTTVAALIVFGSEYPGPPLELRQQM
jgi:hypothetical protein